MYVCIYLFFLQLFIEVIFVERAKNLTFRNLYFEGISVKYVSMIRMSSVFNSVIENIYNNIT